MCYYVNRNTEQLLKGEPPLIQFTQNLKQLREARGLSRQELADMAGISSAAIGYYETGKREPQASTLVSIAAALHVSVDDLLGYHVDDFNKAATLFHESTGETATLNGDGVIFSGGMMSKWKWRRPISKAAFLQAMHECVETFNRETRPRLLKDAIINHIDTAYQKEYGLESVSPADSEITKFVLAVLKHDKKMAEMALKNSLSGDNLVKFVHDELRKRYEEQEQNDFANKQPTPPQHKHDADDKPATEKGPHSKE